MREVVDGINGIPHSEEAAQRLSRRTHSADPTDRKFFHTPESGILYLSGAYWIPGLRMASPQAGQKRDRWASAGMTIFGMKLAFPQPARGHWQRAATRAARTVRAAREAAGKRLTCR
jgi:hypothetical protein